MGVFPLGISDVVQFFGSIIELIGVLLIVCGVLCASFNALISYKRKSDSLLIYNRLKTSIARTLLLGLEILVAADVIRTVVFGIGDTGCSRCDSNRGPAAEPCESGGPRLVDPHQNHP